MTRAPTIALLLALGSAALGKESDHALVTLRMSTGAELISARSGSLRWTAKRLDADRVQVQVSTGTWASVGTAINRYDGSTGWKQHTIDLTAYKGTTVQLGFLGISVFGNNVFIDDVVVTTP